VLILFGWVRDWLAEILQDFSGMQNLFWFGPGTFVGNLNGPPA
jgi:hypothetical protein